MARQSTARKDAARHGADPDLPARQAQREVTSRLPDLDRIIHERMRLGIISALAVNDVLSFNDLKSLLGTTDGNLSVHARKLEVAEYISCTKSFEGRQPRTEFRITASGRRALDRYLQHMDALVQAMKRR